MNKMSDRPPILQFLLAFGCLLAAAIGLAALSSTTDQALANNTSARGGSVNVNIDAEAAGRLPVTTAGGAER